MNSYSVVFDESPKITRGEITGIVRSRIEWKPKKQSVPESITQSHDSSSSLQCRSRSVCVKVWQILAGIAVLNDAKW
jgi:hypothetical protein